MLNYRPNGHTWKTFEKAIMRGQNRSTKAQLMKDNDNDDDDLYTFALEDSSRIAPPCQNMYEFDICYEFILLSAFFG